MGRVHIEDKDGKHPRMGKIAQLTINIFNTTIR